MSQDKQDIFKLSPLSWEENQPTDSINSDVISVPPSPTLSLTQLSKLSKTSSINSINTFNYRKNAGNTPKKPLKIKNSLEALRNKFKYESRFEIKEDTTQLCKESAISLTEKQSQFDLIARNSNSFLTLDEIHDSNVDVFENSESPKINSSTTAEQTAMPLDFNPLRLLANYSCYYEDKSKFAPESSCGKTNQLEKELFKISWREIQDKVDGVLDLLEDSNEKETSFSPSIFNYLNLCSISDKY